MRTALFLAALTASALAGPTGQRTSCALHCNNADIFSYQTGKSYVYDYSVSTSTALLGTFDDDAHMHITAKAHIDVSAPCEYTLRLTEVTLDGSSHSQELATAVSKSPLRFSFQDGRVENVCSEVTEPAWVLNFKRGVLSTFQSSMTHQGMQDVQETDIAGVCTTHYNSVMEGNTMTVEKTKDLNSCTGRANLASYVPSSGYVSDSPVQSLPVFKSTNKCNQRIEEGLLKMAECEETHKFRPFSSEEGGAVTTAKTTMTLVSHDGPAVPIADFQFNSKSLVFDQVSTSSVETQTEVIVKILNDLEEASREEVLPEVPVLFSTLVASLKGLDYPTLKNVYVNTKQIHSRKFLVDAMPLVGTAAAVGVVRDMFINGDMTNVDADVWFTSLAFFKNPTSEMFTALAPLLESNPSQEAMLGTSALVNTYCKIHPDCAADSGVQQVLRRIESQLGSGCRTVNEEQKMKVLVALKALGNAGRWVNANPILRQCYTEDNDMEIRVAAIDAWRHTPCEYDRSNLLAAFQDETQDTEVRIAAYLAVMTCPTQTVIDTIKDRLTSEGVNQVGSFIWTHMTNLQESAAQGKQWVRELIGEELLQKKFSTEALKFSRNYESSFFMNELNAGAALDSNVIFSSKSFLPRSAMLNLTLDLFGESINLFEIGGRIEGFEAYVERFFGPYGYFPQETVEGIIRNMRQQKPDADATTLEGFLDQVTDEPEGSYYLRVFGKELHYNHFHGLEDLMTSGASNPLEILMELARKGEVDYTKSYQVIDTHYTIPTVSGLPVTLTAKGTATLALKMNGNFRAQNFKNIDIEGHIHPSAAVQMDGLMVVDAHVTRTGMKVSSTLHTSTFLDGKVKINGGKVVDIAVNTPKDKMEVIDVSTKFFYLEDDQEIRKGEEHKVKSEGCTRIVSGLEACSELSYTPSSVNSPSFPLTGPASVHVYLQKTDTQTGYILRFKREGNEIAFEFDTPGSQVDRKVSLIITKSEQAINFDLQTPFKSVKGNGEYIWRRNNKNIKLDLTMDNNERYNLETGLRTTRGDVNKIESSLVITSPRGKIVDAKGTFQASFAEGKYVADAAVSGVTASPLTFHGSFERDGKSAGVEVVLDTAIHVSAKGRIGREDNYMTSAADVEYTTLDGHTHTIRHSGHYKLDTSEELDTYSVNFELTPSQFPDKSVSYDFKTMISAGRIEHTGKLILGPATWNFEDVYSYTNENNHFAFYASAGVKCAYHGIDFLTLKELKFAPYYLYDKLQVTLAPGKDYFYEVDFNMNEDREVSGSVSIANGDGRAAVEVLLTKIAAGHYKAQVTGKVLTTEEKTVVLEGTVRDNSVPGKINVRVDGSLKCDVLTMTVNSGIYADADKASAELSVNDQQFAVKIEVTRTSFLVDANVYRHIVVSAAINATNEVQKLLVSAEWDKDVDPTRAFMITGQLSPAGVEAGFKFTETEVSASCKLVDNGVEMAAMWAPDKRVLGHVHYSLDDTKSLAITVETPFPGWEKQDVTFTVSLKDYEITSRAVATWKNAEQMALTINGMFQPGLSTNALTTKILFTSSFESFERITFTVDHNMAGATINTNIEGLWNTSEMKGNFQLTPNDNGVDVRATFISPFSEDVLVTLHHELFDMALTTKLEAKYGAETSTITVKGHVDVRDVTLVLRMITPQAVLPQIDANIKYTLNKDNINLIAEGKAGEKKVSLNMNGEKTTTEGSTAISGDFKFTSPFTYPLTMTLSHNHDGQQFISQFEMTRIWSTFGKVKMHAEGHMISGNEMDLNALLSSPDTKASLMFNHKISDNRMISNVDVTANGERISVSINGILDAASNLANLEGEVTSTYTGLDDVKVKIESQKDSNTRTSNVNLMKGTKSVNIVHIITYNDLLNWENSININGKHKLSNKQSHVGTAYGHEVSYMWDDDVVRFAVTIDPRIAHDSRNIDAQVIIATPWEHYENIKVDLHYADNGVEYKPSLTIEYEPGRIIEITAMTKFERSSFYAESTLTTPFWQPLGYELDLDFQTRKSVTLVFTHGANKTTINTNGLWEHGKLDGRLEIHSTYLTTPIMVETSYDVSSTEKKFHLAVNTDSRYEITGSFSGHVKNAKWSFAAQLPVVKINSLEFSGEYQVATLPFTMNTLLKFESNDFEEYSNTYSVNGKVGTNEFVINTDVNGEKGGVASRWAYQYTHSNIDIEFQSPFSTVDNMALYAMYDFETQKKVQIKLTRGAQEINFIGKLEGKTLVFEGTTPFSGWETLSASFFISKSAINAFITKNDQKLEVTGSVHIKRGKGKVELAITTPYADYEKVSVTTVYNFHGDTKRVEFRSTFGTEELSVKGVVKLADPLVPEIKLNVITPFEVVKTLGGEAQWNLKDSVKTVEVKAFHNDVQYKWQLEAAADGPLKGYATFRVTTPLTGWTDVAVEGSFDFTATPYKGALTYNKEGVVSTIEGNLNIAENEIAGEFTTPITGWEKITLNGAYNIENNHLTGNVEFNKGSEKYEVIGDILFNSRTPKLKIGIKTPFAEAANIHLTLDTDMVYTEKRFSLTFSRNDITYSAEFTGQLIYKTGFVKVVTQSPIPGYTALQVYAKYDFTDDIKTIEINLEKEGQTQHFFVGTKVNNNNVLIDVVTPFEGFEAVKLTGDYTHSLGQHSLMASFVRNSHTYDFRADLVLDVTSALLKISTPIAEIKNVVINGNYELHNDGISGLVNFERNDEVYSFNTRTKFTPMKSSIYVAVDTPVDDWNKLILDVSYDIISDNKSAKISIQKENFSKVISVQANYNSENGSFRIETPIEGFEQLGARYTLYADQSNNKVEASVKVTQNSEEWTFSAYGQYGLDNFIIRFQTPFEEFDVISIEGSNDFAAKASKGVIQFGSRTFSVNVSYALNNMFFELATPFPALKFVSASAAYTWTSSQKDATLTIVYNENSYILNGALTISPRKSGMTLRATTPVDNFRNLSLQINFDIDSRDEMISALVTVGEHTYHFKAGGHIESNRAHFQWDLVSPFHGWTDVKFVAKTDFSQEDKLFEISLEKDGDVKAIAISGKLIGGTGDFSLKTPFTGLHNLNVFGSLNRAKRSAEFRMMNDAGEASIIASFNSAKIHLKTPFERAQEVTWEITKVSEGSYRGQWRRNDNYLTVSIDRVGRSKTFEVAIKSELKGWELLALSGRLDEQTIDGYVSGTINEETITISMQGVHNESKNSEFILAVTTPYDGYQTIDGKLTYNVKRKNVRLEAKSSSSNFEVSFKFNKNSGLQAHLLVPHRRQDTELNVHLTPFKGNIDFTSRFTALRNFHNEYQINIREVFSATYKITVNDLEIYSFELELNRNEGKLHLQIHSRQRDGGHTMVHMHIEGYNVFNFIIEAEEQENGQTHLKEFKIEMSGTGDLPNEGTIDAVITNTFREQPRTIRIKSQINRNTTPKTITMEIRPSPRQLYKVAINYNINLDDPSHGDFDVKISTPDSPDAPWKHISGDWNVQNLEAARLTLMIDEVTYTVQGKLGIRESTMVLTSTDRESENIFLQWKFERQGDYRDYFLKVGRESRYGMLKLKGTIHDFAHFDIEGGFKLGPFQRHEFLFTANANRETDGNITGSGSFDYGNYHGEHRLEEFRRDPHKRAATFVWSATSNYENYRQVSVNGNYDIDGQFVFYADIKADDRISKIDVRIANLNPKYSRNTIEWNIPILGRFKEVQLTLSHDFRNAKKSIEAVAKIGRRQAYVKLHWQRSDALDKFDSNIDIKSKLIGEIQITANFDVSNPNDAHGEVKYTRTVRQLEKTANIKWHRKSSPANFEFELVFDSSLESLSHARAYANADFSDNFHLTSGFEVNDQKITVELDVGNNSISGKITTPFEGFETIEGLLTYSLASKNKSIVLKYERGSRKIDFNFTLNRGGKHKGNFELSLHTPFESIKTLEANGSWSRRGANVDYRRNDIHYSFTGDANLQATKSDFDLSFTAPGRLPIRIAARYNVEDFIAGTGSDDQELASLEFEFEGHKVSFNMNGFRNSDRLCLEIDGESSLEVLRKFHLKLNSDSNPQARDGTFEITLNDFEFEIHNHFERYENNGYYFKSTIESTLTPLPALVFGLGRNGEERIVTVGYGEEKEITFSVKAKNNFKSGFSGFVDIPNFGYEGVKYDVDYGFTSSDELYTNVDIELGEDGKKVEVEFTYNSEGVQARLTSPLTGEHRMRVRRSVSSDSFFTEVGFDDYNLKLRGGFKDEDTKRGAILEGDIFGNKFLIDFLFQSEGMQYSEGKLIIHTPFRGMEKLGGLFTMSNVNNKIMAHAEVLLPSFTTPKITGELKLNLNEKIDGYVTIDVAGEQFTFKSNLVGVSLRQGYQGTVELHTPFHHLSSVVVNGKIQMKSLSFLEVNVKIDEPYDTHELKVNYQLSPEKLTTNIDLHSRRSYAGINVNFILEGFNPAQKKVELTINNDKIRAEYDMNDAAFKINVDTIIVGVPRQLSLDAKYTPLETMGATLITTLGEETHTIHGNFNINSNRIQGKIELESTLIEGTRVLDFNISIPSASYRQVVFDVTLATSETYSLSFELDARTGVHATAKIDTPVLPKISVTIDYAGASAALVVDTPTGTHKAQATWRVTHNSPADWLATVEVMSPLLKETYTFSVMLSGNSTNGLAKAELQMGEIRHAMEASTSTRTNGGGFTLNIETPFKNINRVTLEASLDFGDEVQLQVTANFAGKVNTFNFNFDQSNKTFVTVVQSPYIPTGLVKAEAALSGDTNKNMQLKAALMNNEKTISGILNIKIPSSQTIRINLKVVTPFKGYKKMNFVAKYVKDEFTKIILSLDRPVRFNVDVQFANASTAIMGKLKIETSIEDLEILEAELSIPLNKFAPRAALKLPNHMYGIAAEYERGVVSKTSIDLQLDDASYGGNLALRTKVPYELAYGYHFPSIPSSKFHLRTDSSFVSAFI